jgi:DNA-binding response OmpR family regulator
MNQNNEEKIQGSVKKVLVVDDDVEIREVLYRLLDRSGYQAITQPGGTAVLDYLKNNRVDLIILDERMPGMDGLMTVKNIRDFDKETPIVMLTGFGNGELQISALKLGVNDFLMKGLPAPQFLKTVEETLERHKLFALNKKAPSKAGGKILVVDDEPEVRTMLENFLRKHNHEIKVALSAEEALALLKTGSYRPDAILLDVNLPGMDGLMALKQIRQFDNNIAVIMISGVGDPALRTQALELGALEFFYKPFDLEHMDLTIKIRALGQNESQTTNI